MKKTYINPAVNTANLKVRATLLAGSNMGVNTDPTNGTPQNPVQGGAPARGAGNISVD